MTTALYPGGFDPITNGHLDIVRRASGLFDEVVMAVYPRGSQTFTIEERLELIREATRDCPNVRAEGFSGLVVNFADDMGAQVLVRGIRAMTDFETEFDMALMNKKMAPPHRIRLPHDRPRTPLHLRQPHPRTRISAAPDRRPGPAQRLQGAGRALRRAVRAQHALKR